MAALFVIFAKSVDEAGLHHAVKAGPLFRRETVIVNVCFRMGEVDFLMRHIEVAGEDHRLFPFQFFQGGQKIAVPDLAIIEAR